MDELIEFNYMILDCVRLFQTSLEECKALKERVASQKYKIESLKLNLVSQTNELYFLECLRDAGVDNWQGYEQAQEYYQNTDKK